MRLPLIAALLPACQSVPAPYEATSPEGAVQLTLTLGRLFDVAGPNCDLGVEVLLDGAATDVSLVHDGVLSPVPSPVSGVRGQTALIGTLEAGQRKRLHLTFCPPADNADLGAFRLFYTPLGGSPQQLAVEVGLVPWRSQGLSGADW